MNKKTQDKLKALFNLYTQALPKKMEEIEIDFFNLKKSWDSEKWQEFHRNVHSLCGSSGTYGYLDVSKLARILELEAKEYLDKIPDEAAFNEMEKSLRNLKETIAKSSADDAIKKFLNLPDTTITEKKLIYFLSHDESLIKTLSAELNLFGYNIVALSDFDKFMEEFNKKIPAAMIIESTYLTKDNVRELNKLQQTNQGGLAILILSHQSDFDTRLKAVTAGGQAFFTLPLDFARLAEQLDKFCDSPSQAAYRILIIDDSVMLAEYYALLLQQAGLVTAIVNDPLQLFNVMLDFQPDLILMDIYMPECTGTELAAVLRQHGGYDSIPIVFLSVEADRFKQLHAMNYGGDDFLTKPIQADHLISAVKIRAARYKILRSYIMKDPLTGVFNHTVIQQELESEVKRAERFSFNTAVVMVDIDKFKNINDTYGHPAGDLVIKNLCRFLQKRLRKTDLVGRYGGEEFMVILPNTENENASKIMNEIREGFADMIHVIGDNQFKVTFSAGIASSKDWHNPKAMVKNADIALYKAKHGGRNCVRVANITDSVSDDTEKAPDNQ